MLIYKDNTCQALVFHSCFYWYIRKFYHKNKKIFSYLEWRHLLLFKWIHFITFKIVTNGENCEEDKETQPKQETSLYQITNIEN